MVSRIAAVGLALSVVGAALDFASGTLILQAASMPIMPGMRVGSVTTNAMVWSLLLFGLGGLLLITGVLGVTHVSMGRMHIFGGLMAIYGIIMLIIGALMLMEITPMMQGVIFSSTGMVIVGFGMIVKWTTDDNPLR
jgi:hypothetical protein